MQKNKGITLVALIITIIILLILAGVAISMITGGEGIFAQANSAATKYNQAAKNEADFLNQLLNGGDEETPKEPVPDLIKESNMDFIYKPDTWTNGTVNVEITTEITGYTLQYSLDEGETWNDYTEEIPVTTNGKIILARLVEGERTGGIATGQVENIDTLKPRSIAEIKLMKINQSELKISGSSIDADEIEGISGKSGIRGYKYKLNDNEWTEETNDTSYTFSISEVETNEPKADGTFDTIAKVNSPDTSQLPNNTTSYITWRNTYNMYMKAIDVAGNESNPTIRKIWAVAHGQPVNFWYDYNNGEWANITTKSLTRRFKCILGVDS